VLRDLKVHSFLPFVHFVYRCFMSWLAIVLFRIGHTTCAECSSKAKDRHGPIVGILGGEDGDDLIRSGDSTAPPRWMPRSRSNSAA
jgi:hypothetical protein